MTSRLPSLIGAAALACALTLFVTWPQVLHPVMVADHFDPYFSVWRLGHIAHALTRWPIHLFDGNIFHPATQTLAYSDAVLLQGIIAAPLFWMGLSPSVAYNLLMLAGFVGSGVAVFILARHLTGARGPALVATAIFTGLPYRIEHVHHLELQWAMFVPLALWAVHRTMESGRWKHGLLAGVFVWLQFLSCIYYGLFLVLTLLVFVPVLLTVKGHVKLTSYAPPLLAGGALAALLTLPYAWPYMQASRLVGVRNLDEIARFSAHAVSYLATTEDNRLWGWTANLWGAQELRLFPGLVALVLALAALLHPRRRMVILYAVTTFIVVQLSFGLNGTLYRLLLGQVAALQGFRALARFGIIAGCLLSVLAALGLQAILRRLRWTPRAQQALVAAVLVAIAVEYANRPIRLTPGLDATPPDVYKVLERAEPGAIVEFPLPAREELPGWDANYEAWSVWHWRPLVNGYSGFYPREYLDTVEKLKSFPDARSLDILRGLGVRYVIVHRDAYKRDKYTTLALAMARTPALSLWGVYKDPLGLADIFELGPP